MGRYRGGKPTCESRHRSPYLRQRCLLEAGPRGRDGAKQLNRADRTAGRFLKPTDR
jgi:hypothetical protein